MDKKNTTTSSSTSSWMMYSILAVILSTCVIYSPFSSTTENEPISKYSLLNVFARDAMAWNISTTPIPISSPSVILKSILSKDSSSVPEELRHLMDQDTVKIQQVRNYLNNKRFQHLLQLCSGSNQPHCRDIINTPDPEFGLTPLHLARAYGDDQTASFLLSLGANADLLDSVGRKPQNMSFSSFIANSKKFNLGRNCDIPSVTVRSAQDFTEVRRLISEGEPVLMKGAMHFLRNADELASLSLPELVARYGSSRVTVGEVPYADVFKLKHSISNLQDYYTQHVLTKSSAPLYIFQKNENVTKEGLDGLSDLVKRAFPNMVCPVEYGQTGVDSIHFYLGAKNSGAPFHIHADAINLVVSGEKHWFMYPPIQAIYSRKHISRWIEEDYPTMKEEEKPLECIQEAGDIIYVPFDWGHAVLNTAEQTFGYALEVLNRREVFASLPEMYQDCK